MEFVPQLLQQRILDGDRTAEDELARHFAPRLLAMFAARTRDPELSRDLVQDALIAVLQQVRRGAVRDPEKLPAFVQTVGRNVLMNHFRKRGRSLREEPLEADVCAPPAFDFAAEDRRERLLESALGQLDSTDRQILSRSLVEGEKPGRIASMLGLAPDVIRQRKFRALRKISDYIRTQAGGKPVTKAASSATSLTGDSQ